MPIYEYKCDICYHSLEEIQGFNDPELVMCPNCNDAGLKRVISPAAFHLKGSGWYESQKKKLHERFQQMKENNKDEE